MRPLRDLGFLVLLSASVAVAGCGSGARNPGSGPARSGAGSKPVGRIGAVLPMFSHPFFLAQKRGLEAKAKELGVAIDVRDGQDDDVKQISQVETLINLGCEALILCPRDEDALVPAVEAANRAGVPIIALNRRINGGNVQGWKETVVFGFDGSRTAFDAIRKGGLKATILQDPLEQGKKAVETMVAHLRGQSLDPEIITPLRLITQANVDRFQPAY
jgi:ABC-type sugar transport system substrate-binding protein